MLDGSGEGVALAMRIVTGLARVRGQRLVDVTGAHIDSCLYHGRPDWTSPKLVDLGARVRVPDPQCRLPRPAPSGHSPRRRRAPRTAHGRAGSHGCLCGARGQDHFHLRSLSGRCAARRGRARGLGESNAIVFANSVLGARTDRYGDFLDISAAITGRAPGPDSTSTRPAGPTSSSTSRPSRRNDGTTGPGMPCSVTSWVARPGHGGGDRRPASDSERGRPQGARGGRGLVRWRRNLPCGGGHAGGSDAGERSGAHSGSASSAGSRTPTWQRVDARFCTADGVGSTP